MDFPGSKAYVDTLVRGQKTWLEISSLSAPIDRTGRAIIPMQQDAILYLKVIEPKPLRLTRIQDGIETTVSTFRKQGDDYVSDINADRCLTSQPGTQYCIELHKPGNSEAKAYIEAVVARFL